MRKNIPAFALSGLIAFMIPFAVLVADSPQKEKAQGSVEEGQALYKKHCNMCHFPDKPTKKLGPGLKGLFSLKELPQSHKPAAEDVIREQIAKGSKAMPPFAKKLSPEQMGSLIAYLKTL